MKEKEKLNYMLQELRNYEAYTLKDLKKYCYIHHIAEDEREFQTLMTYMIQKGWVELDQENKYMTLKNPPASTSVMQGIFGTGGTLLIAWDPTRTTIQPMI